MIDQISVAILTWMIILPASFLSGSAAKRWFDAKDNILNGVIACALGFAILSYGVVGLSYTVGLRSSFIWGFLAALLLIRLKQLPEYIGWLRAIIYNFSWLDPSYPRLLLSLSWIAIAVLFLAAMTPEIGGDALVYHLNLPKGFLTQGSLAPNPEDLNSYFPLFMNNLYLIGLATGGVLTAKLFNFFIGFLMWLALQRIVYRETAQTYLALAAGSIFLLTPVFYNLFSTTYVDPAVAFYTFLSVFLFIHAASEKKRGLFLISGFLIGCAFSIKYLAVISLLAFSMLWVWWALQARNSKLFLTSLFFWSAGLLLAGGYWIIRNWLTLHNPIFPYLSSVFGTAEVPGSRFESYGIGKSLFHFLILFWHLFRHPSAFGAFSDRVGIFYLLALPFAIFAVFRMSRSRPYFVFLAAFLALWFYVCQANRYVLPALPILLVLASLGLGGIEKKKQSPSFMLKSGNLVVMGGLVFYLIAGIYHYRYAMSLHLGIWKPADYLINLERTIPIASWTNQHLPQNSKILLASEPRQFYFKHRLIRDVFLQYRTQYQKKEWKPDELAQYLKSLQITHVLLSRPQDVLDAVVTEPLLVELVSSSFARLIYTGVSKNIRDAQYQYELYELN